MSQKVTVTEGSTITLKEAVLNALEGKEDHLVSIDTNGDVVLFTGSIPAVGWYQGRLQPGSTAVRVRLLGKGGTVRAIQSAAINPGVRVMGVNASARVATATTGNRTLGTKISPGAGAAGDVIEIADADGYLP